MAASDLHVRNLEDLPAVLSVEDLAAALRISRSGAYNLARSQGFPAIRIGRRIVVPKRQLLAWLEREAERQLVAIPDNRTQAADKPLHSYTAERS